MQTILGASGLLGKELAKALTQYTKAIRLVSRKPEKVNPSDQLVATDITIPRELFKAVNGSKVVYVAVGFKYSASVWKELWPPFLQNIVIACKKHGARLVFFDNVYMYDRDHIYHMTEDTPVLATSRKGKVRADLSNDLWDEIENGRLEGLIARSADFLASRNSIPVETIYKRFKEGKKAQWFVDANKIHNFTYIKDAARATALLGNTDEAFNHIWHLPTDKTKMTGKDWIELFAREMNVEPEYKLIKKWQLNLAGIFNPFMRELTEMCYQYDRDYFFDSTRFEEKFDLKPTPPEEAVREIISELENRKK